MNGTQGAAVPGGSESSSASRGLDTPGLARNEKGVPVYDFGTTPEIPRLDLPKEETVKSSRYALDNGLQKVMDERVISPFNSPDNLTLVEFKKLAMITTGKVAPASTVKDVTFRPKGKVSRDYFDKIVMNVKPETKIELAKFKPLSPEEFRFMSGLLLYQQGDKCAAAVGLFHRLSKIPSWQSESDYYLAMCSRKLGLETDFMERSRRVIDAMDVHYSVKLMKEIGYQVPYEFTESFGAALAKAVNNPKFREAVDDDTRANVAFILTEYGAATGKFELAQTWAPQVPETHPKYLQARFLNALAEYHIGSKAKALEMQQEIIASIKTDKQKAEFQALVALNAARMYFQEKDFKNARESFLMVYKDHPLWLQSLTELGWSQLMSGDYEGAIGNMYSIQSPFFSAVYKPESYVIRTIGYLNLCQYGDAYRTLSVLEQQYRPSLDRMEAFTKDANRSHYDTVRTYLVAAKAAQKEKDLPKEVNGLPSMVIREMARHRDFTNHQKALNRQLDERLVYNRLDAEVEKSLKRAQWLVNNSRKTAETLRKNIQLAAKKPAMEQNRKDWSVALERELDELNGHFFQVDLFGEAKASLSEYRGDVVAGADKRLASLRDRLEKTLRSRLSRMKTELARMLENNELLRYEVFSGSGENIRYQVAGGEKGNRVPASILPKSKSLHWDFDGEYWEDEIGHYRSSLKNNCPDSHSDQASLGGGVQ